MGVNSHQAFDEKPGIKFVWPYSLSKHIAFTLEILFHPDDIMVSFDVYSLFTTL